MLLFHCVMQPPPQKMCKFLMRPKKSSVRISNTITTIPIELKVIDVVTQHTYVSDQLELNAYRISTPQTPDGTTCISRKTFGLQAVHNVRIRPDSYRNNLLNQLTGKERDELIETSFSNENSVDPEQLYWPCLLVREEYLKNELSTDGSTNVRKKDVWAQFYKIVEKMPNLPMK